MRSDFNRTILVSTFLFLLSACFPGDAFFTQSHEEGVNVEEVKVQLVGEAAQASMSATSTVTQKITVPEGSTIQGATLAIPPGALNVDMTVSIEETVSITSLQGGEEVENGSFAAIGVTNSAGVEKLSAPMTIQIPLSDSSTLSLQNSAEPNAVKLRISSAGSSSCKEVFILDDEFTIGTLEGSSKYGITLEKEYFGAYQPLILKKNFLTSLKQARDTVKDRIANGTATQEELLSARDGCPIVTKTKKKELDQASPIIIGTVTSKIENRILVLTAPVTSSTAISSCSVNISNSYDKAAENQLATSTNNTVTIDLTNQHRILSGEGQFSCSFADGRNVQKLFKNIAAKANPRLTYDNDGRGLTIFSGLPQGGSCYIIDVTPEELRKSDDQGSDGDKLETIDDPDDIYIDFSRDEGGFTVHAQIVCDYSNGSKLVTESFVVTVPACEACTEDNEPPTINSALLVGAVETPGAINLSLNAEDNLGLQEICINLAKKDSPFHGQRHCEELESETGGDISVSFPLPAYLPLFEYELREIQVRDISGNERSLSAHGDHNGPATHYRTRFWLRNNTGSHSEQNTSISFIRFTPAAGDGHNSDGMPPLLNGVNPFPTAVSAGNEISITFTATDEGPSADPKPDLQFCFKTVSLSNPNESNHFCLWDLQPTSTANQFTGKTYFGEWLSNGDHKVVEFMLQDAAFEENILEDYDGDSYWSSALQNSILGNFQFTFSGGADRSPPDVTSITRASLDPLVVAFPTDIELDIVATDDSNIEKVCIAINRWDLTEQEQELGCDNSLEYDPDTATYRANFAAPDYLENNVYYSVTRMHVYDSEGNRAKLYQDAADASSYEGSSLSIPTWKFLNAATDTTPPTITNVELKYDGMNISGNTIDVSGGYTAQVVITATDAGAGIDPHNICYSFETASGATDVVISVCGAERLSADTYQSEVYFHQWMANSEYKLLQLHVRDKRGENVSVNAVGHASTDYFYPANTAIPSITITGGDHDNVPPVQVGSGAETLGRYGPVDFVHGDTVTFYVKATDAKSGFDMESMCFEIKRSLDDQVYVNQCTQLRATSTSDLYEFDVHISNHFLAGGEVYYLSSFSLFDKAGNVVTNSAGSPATAYDSWTDVTAPSFDVEY